MMLVLAVPPPEVGASGWGAVTGLVVDPAGDSHADTSITLVGESLIGGPRQAVTGRDGRFHFWNLPPGLYQLKADARGYSTARVRDITVVSGSTVTVRLQFSSLAISETVRVDRPDGLDVSSAALRVHLDQRLLQSLPVSRDAADLINLAPGVTRSVGFGGTIGSNALSVEGVETTEPRRQAAWIVLPTTWAAAVDVVGPGADVDRGEFTGVVGEARLKTGSNELSGLAEWWTTHPSWIDEHQPNLGRRLDDWWQLDLQTGLPLAGDRVWLFAAGHLTRLEERPPGFTGTGTRSEWTPRYLARLSPRCPRLESAWRDGAALPMPTGTRSTWDLPFPLPSPLVSSSGRSLAASMDIGRRVRGRSSTCSTGRSSRAGRCHRVDRALGSGLHRRSTSGEASSLTTPDDTTTTRRATSRFEGR